MRWIATILCVAFMLGAGSAVAFGEQDRAREAARRGEIMPLAAIQRNVRQRIDGKIIGTHFRSGNERYVYEFRVLRPNGSVMNIDVDARTSRILHVQGAAHALTGR